MFLGYNDSQVEEFYDKIAVKQPLGGVIEPEEIAEAALVLSSSRFPHLTGQFLVVDGGRSQHPV